MPKGPGGAPKEEAKQDGPVEVRQVVEVRQEGYGLPPGFEWFNLDLADDKMAQ